jgi:hypothetical protein
MMMITKYTKLQNIAVMFALEIKHSYYTKPYKLNILTPSKAGKLNICITPKDGPYTFSW